MSKKAGPKKSERIHIMTSGCCNNNCIFCCDRETCDGRLKLTRRYLEAYGCAYLTLEGFLKESKKTKGADSILFTGGEPTLNKGLISFIKLARKSGYMDIGIQTNGRLLSYKDFCTELIESGVSEINISLHGSNNKIHDALTRTPGSFKETYKGLSNAVALKNKYTFRINTNFTITRLNYRDIACYIRMLQSYEGIKSFVLNTLMYTGNARKYFRNIFVSYSDIAKEVKKAVDGLKYRANLNVQLSPMPFCLMSGYEDFVGRFERPFEIRDKKARATSRGANQAKSKDCLSCKYHDFCSGIDTLYAEKKGWSEFSPVKSQ